jgi:alpha-galactosidase
MPGFGVIPPGNWGQSVQSRAAVKQAYDECRAVAPLMLGDYYPLTPYSLQLESWIAWQFHRDDLGEGVVQAFRRANADDETITVQLRGLEPEAHYDVNNFDGGATTHTGCELTEGFKITLKSKPAAALFKLKKQH